MSILRPSNEQQLNLANTSICNALGEPGLASALAGFGYTTERLQEGSALYAQALALYQQQQDAYGDLQSAIDTYTAVQALAQETYVRYVKLARIALARDPNAMNKLGLAGARKRIQAGQLAQSQQFYARALYHPAIRDKLAEYSITPLMLKAGQQQVEAVAESGVVRRKHQGIAQDATSARDAAMLELADWLGDLHKIARVALKKRPQLLEMMGIRVRAARPATRPAAESSSSVAAAVAEAAAPPADSPPPVVEEKVVRSRAAKRNGTKPIAVPE